MTAFTAIILAEIHKNHATTGSAKWGIATEQTKRVGARKEKKF